jgi:hypothetical protein
MMPGFPMPGMPFPQMPAMSMPSMPAMSMPSIQPSYVPGQFFGGARNQFPTLPNAQMMKQAFPQGMPTMQGFPTMSMPGFPSGNFNFGFKIYINFRLLKISIPIFYSDNFFKLNCFFVIFIWWCKISGTFSKIN